MTDKNFEKDINVPSKTIGYPQDAKDCEQYCPDNTCCTCRNREWYRLYNDYKTKEQESEFSNLKIIQLKETLSQYETELDQLKKEREKAKNYNLEYGQLLIKATNKNNKLSKTLTEIKEIAESVTGCGSKCETCEADGYCADCEDEILKQILQKIIEVER